MIVPISDEGPCLGTSTNGCNDPGSDREATTNAIAVAVANDVIVSPITASGSTTCVITLAGALAAGTGGTAVQSTNPSSDLADAIATIVLAVCASVTECDDADPCTNDLCGANGACAHTPRCEACCLPDRTCRDDRTQAGCESMEGEFRGVGIPCWGDDDGDGMDDMCEAGRVAIPTVSEWGLTILAPLLLTTGKVYLGRRKLAAT